MEISFIYKELLVHLRVNKTDFHMKGFALGLALKQRRKVTRKVEVRFTSVVAISEALGGMTRMRLPKTMTAV